MSAKIEIWIISGKHHNGHWKENHHGKYGNHKKVNGIIRRLTVLSRLVFLLIFWRLGFVLGTLRRQAPRTQGKSWPARKKL